MRDNYSPNMAKAIIADELDALTQETLDLQAENSRLREALIRIAGESFCTETESVEDQMVRIAEKALEDQG